MKKLTFIYLAILILAARAHSQFITNVSKVGITAAPFLTIGVGARPIGMGGAFVGIANDATAVFWNPAGLARLTKHEAVMTHTNWFIDTNLDFAGLALTLGNDMGTIGINIISLSMGEMKIRTVAEPDGTGERFGAGDLSAGISYARSLTDRFSIGGSAKYISQRIWHMSASSFAIDIGTIFTTRFNDMKIGMCISNFGTKMKFGGEDVLVFHDIDPEKYGNNDKIPAHLLTERWSLPLTFRVGIAMDILKEENNRLTVAIDALHPNDNTESINLGIEYDFSKLMVLRLGYKSMFLRNGEDGITAGIGLKYDRIGSSLKLDYAFQTFGRLGNVQRLSLGVAF